MLNKITIKSFIINLVYNIGATAVPLVLLQIFILPLLSKQMDGDSYGLLVTLVALFNLVPGVLGIALNNIRILKDKNTDAGINNSYQKLLLELCIINCIVVNVISFFFEKGIGFGTILTTVLSLLWLLREYYICQFQLQLLYNKILVNNSLLSVGYILGYGLFLLTQYWQLVYITGYLLSLIHLLIKGDYWKEKIIKSPSYGRLQKETYMLILSALLIRITTYADRLIIYPLLGGTLVSIYYAATVISKLVSMAINPISNVILAYMSKLKHRPLKIINRLILIIGAVCLIGYCFILCISNLALSILYKEYMEMAVNLVPITALSSMIYVLISVLNPLILNFFDMKWQIIINGSNVILYLIISLIGLKIGGLIGFCVGSVIVNILKLFSMIILFYRGKTKENGEILESHYLE